MRKITEIIIHCADTPDGKEFHAADIDRWHKERGWSGIGYHFVICVDGSVEAGRGLDYIGAHAQGYNAASIGVCLIGKSKFTQAQWSSLALLVGNLQRDYSGCRVFGHYEVDQHGKTCPNFDVPAWVRNGFVPAEKNILKEVV